MKKEYLTITSTIFLVLFCITAYCLAEEAKQEEMKRQHKTVFIHEHEGLIPQVLIAKLGTTVTWMNDATVEAEILFSDKKVLDAAACLVNFFIGKNGTYESHKMCAGCTASLCFQEKGTFDYIVKESRTFYGGDKEYRGTILIE